MSLPDQSAPAASRVHGAGEQVALITLRWTVFGSAAAIPLLLFPQPTSLLLATTVHLAIVVAFGFALAFRLAPITDSLWFGGVSPRWRAVTTGGWTVVLVAGASGVVTLATSAAMRLHPSLQLLQLLSALDIAWAGAALAIGLRWRWGSRVAVAGAAVLGVVCVWSIWRYLGVVGFGDDGSWVVDASRLMTLVLPYDMAAAGAAITAMILGARRLTPAG